MEFVKFTVLGALFGVIATVVGDVAAIIAATSTLGIGLGWFWRRVLWPNAKLYEQLQGFPDWMAKHDLERAEIKQRLAALEANTGVAAESTVAIARDLGVHRRGEPPAAA